MYDKAYFIRVHLLLSYISVYDISTSFPLTISVLQIFLFPNVGIQEDLLGICAESLAGVHLKVMNNSCNFCQMLTKMFRQISVKVLNIKCHQNPF